MKPTPTTTGAVIALQYVNGAADTLDQAIAKGTKAPAYAFDHLQVAISRAYVYGERASALKGERAAKGDKMGESLLKYAAKGTKALPAKCHRAGLDAIRARLFNGAREQSQQAHDALLDEYAAAYAAAIPVRVTKAKAKASPTDAAMEAILEVMGELLPSDLERLSAAVASAQAVYAAAAVAAMAQVAEGAGTPSARALAAVA